MSNDQGKWLPYNLDGSLHECRESTNKKDNGNKFSRDLAKPQTTTALTLELLDQRIKKLEESIDKRLKRIERTLFGDSININEDSKK